MIVEFKDSVAGVPEYVNPSYVVTLRPDPVDPTRVTMVKLSDGETFMVLGDHREVADRLAHSLVRLAAKSHYCGAANRTGRVRHSATPPLLRGEKVVLSWEVRNDL